MPEDTARICNSRLVLDDFGAIHHFSFVALSALLVAILVVVANAKVRPFADIWTSRPFVKIVLAHVFAATFSTRSATFALCAICISQAMHPGSHENKKRDTRDHGFGEAMPELGIQETARELEPKWLRTEVTLGNASDASVMSCLSWGESQ